MSDINVLFFNISSKFIWTLVDTSQSDRMRDSTAAISSSVVETTHQSGLFWPRTLSCLWANFLHQTCIAGLVKHLSPSTGHISEWMAFEQSAFAHRKRTTKCCSLQDAFSCNIAMVIVYKWRHSKVIVIYLLLRIKLRTKPIFGIFHILKINWIMPFCNLFIEWSSYIVTCLL